MIDAITNWVPEIKSILVYKTAMKTKQVSPRIQNNDIFSAVLEIDPKTQLGFIQNKRKNSVIEKEIDQKLY